jgi:hypothetical protein
MIETFQLIAEGVDSAIITAENSLEDLFEAIEKFGIDSLRGESIWLEANADAETAKRAFLYRGELLPAMVQNISPLLGKSGAFYSLGLTRHPLWEKVAAQTGSTTDISCLGGKWALADLGGTVDGRMSKFALTGRSGGGGPLSRFWVGVRPLYDGHATLTFPWECESGDLGTDASSEADAASSGGNRVKVTFATVATLDERVGLELQDFVTNTYDAKGRYLVLVRAWVSAGVVALQMRTGFDLGSNTNLQPHKTIYVSNTAAHLLELGEIVLPPVAYRDVVQDDQFLDFFNLKFFAERISGAGNLYLDCVVLIPSEHSFFVDGAAVQYDTSADNMTAYTFEDDENQAIFYENDGSISRPGPGLDVSFTNWKYPVGGGVVFIAGERAAGMTITDDVNPSFEMYARWRNHAG